MAVGLTAPEKLTPVDGIRLATVKASVRYPDRRDLVLFEIAERSSVAAVFTRNAFCAAPVTIAKTHLDIMPARYLLVNTGNANAGTGEQGIADAVRCCRVVAEKVGVPVQSVLPFSTGVIGERLPVERIEKAIPELFDNLDEDGWVEAANGIMTTDTVAKGISRQITLENGEVITITGIAKGSGMIRPDMATMLAYIATDANIAPGLLFMSLQNAVRKSFNRVTVDGDTSTNDACVAIATGKKATEITVQSEADYADFLSALTDVCQYLAQALIRDGEGATKFLTIRVTGASNEEEAEQVAYTVAHSPLVKTAVFASDPNWGRILAAVGRAPVSGLDLGKVSLSLGDVNLIKNGMPNPDYTEEAGAAVMKQDEIVATIRLGRGNTSVTVWTCDFSYDYVRINAEYRS